MLLNQVPAGSARAPRYVLAVRNGCLWGDGQVGQQPGWRDSGGLRLIDAQARMAREGLVSGLVPALSDHER